MGGTLEGRGFFSKVGGITVSLIRNESYHEESERKTVKPK